jgi:hypothetical protein
MKIVLTRKLADHIDGVDVSESQVGDVLELPPAQANLLVAEEWAVLERRRAEAQSESVEIDRRQPRAS